MSIVSEINRINTNIANAYSKCNEKGATMPQTQNSSNLASTIDSISSGGGADLSDYFTSTISSGTQTVGGYVDMVKKIPNNTIVSGTSLEWAFRNFKGTEIPSFDTSDVLNVYGMCSMASNLITLPQFNLSNCTSFSSMCYGCSNLENVPILDTSKANRLSSMFGNCPKLTDTSLDNILQTCINSGVITSSRKKLTDLGFTSENYPASRIQALPHYQDFIDAGWTIGY